MTNDYRITLHHQLEVLTEEIRHVKDVINLNGFDVTTAPYVIVKRYRDELKAHAKLIRETIADLDS